MDSNKPLSQPNYQAAPTTNLVPQGGDMQSYQGSQSSVPSQKPKRTLANSNNRGTDFFIRACGRDGHYLLASQPGQVFCLALNEGKSKSLDDLKSPPQSHFAIAQTKILVTRDMSERSMFSFLRCAVPVIFLLLSGLSFAAWKAVVRQRLEHTFKQIRFLKIAFFVNLAVLIIWYATCLIP